MQLKKTIIQRIRKHKRLKAALMDHFNISPSSLYRWLDSNEPSFTEYKSLSLICSYLGVDEFEDLLEPIESVVE